MERLPDAELEVMQALWRQEKYPVSSAALMEELAGRRWQTATLLKLLSRLEERGFVKREKEGRNNLYTPLVRREDYLSAESRAFLQRLHGGSLPSLVAALMDSRAISRRDLEELEEILRGGTAVRAFLSGLFEVSLTMGAVTALLLVLSPVWKRRFRPQWRCWAWLLVALRQAVPFNVSLPRAPVVLEAPAPAAVSAAWVEEGGFQGVELTARTLPPGEAAPEAAGRGVSLTTAELAFAAWAAVAAERPYLKYPADLYLEGGDQYRGWFQSSMLTSIAVNGVAPYKQIATHGWTVDGEGKAMHKSLGNAVSPDEVIKDYGADMLRLWVASADYTQDMRISKDIMKQLSQAYLKIRNTARYMLGNLCDFEPDRDLVPAENLMELDRYALHTFNELAKTARAAYDRYEFHAVYRAVYNFCVVDMSNFYLDIIKDRLYCGAEAERRSAQTALYHILDGMTRLIAPILAFTSDEIWHAMKHAQGVNAESVLFNDMPGDNAAFALDAAARERWAKLVSLRDAVNKALENARNAGVFKKAQDTDVPLSVSESDAAFLAGVDLASLCIVSKVTVTTGAVEGEKSEDCLIPCTIAVALDESPKCPRCWNHSEHIGADGHHNQLCDRCAAVVGE